MDTDKYNFYSIVSGRGHTLPTGMRISLSIQTLPFPMNGECAVMKAWETHNMLRIQDH